MSYMQVGGDNQLQLSDVRSIDFHFPAILLPSPGRAGKVSTSPSRKTMTLCHLPEVQVGTTGIGVIILN